MSVVIATAVATSRYIWKKFFAPKDYLEIQSRLEFKKLSKRIALQTNTADIIVELWNARKMILDREILLRLLLEVLSNDQITETHELVFENLLFHKLLTQREIESILDRYDRLPKEKTHHDVDDYSFLIHLIEINERNAIP